MPPAERVGYDAVVGAESEKGPNMKKSVLAAVICLLFSPLAIAHEHEGAHGGAVPEEMIKAMESVEKKIVDLVNAMPDEALAWRPAEGVRSTGESVMHVVGANYFFGSQLGAEMPEGVNPRAMSAEGMTGEQLAEAVSESFGFAKMALRELDEENMSEELELFGQTLNKRLLTMYLFSHGSEHLGQLIAYARVNDVTPPWSQ